MQCNITGTRAMERLFCDSKSPLVNIDVNGPYPKWVQYKNSPAMHMFIATSC